MEFPFLTVQGACRRTEINGGGVLRRLDGVKKGVVVISVGLQSSEDGGFISLYSRVQCRVFSFALYFLRS